MISFPEDTPLSNYELRIERRPGSTRWSELTSERRFENSSTLFRTMRNSGVLSTSEV